MEEGTKKGAFDHKKWSVDSYNEVLKTFTYTKTKPV